MASLAHHTSPELIVCPLRSGTAQGIIGELCSALSRAGRLQDPLAFYNAVITHEALSSSATPPGWALPHARQPGLKRLSFAVGRSASPLDWSGTSVQLVFLMAVPQNQSAAHLALISGLARLSQNQPQVERLLQAPDSQTLFDLLQQVPLPKPQTTCRA